MMVTAKQSILSLFGFGTSDEVVQVPVPGGEEEEPGFIDTVSGFIMGGDGDDGDEEKIKDATQVGVA